MLVSGYVSAAAMASVVGWEADGVAVEVLEAGEAMVGRSAGVGKVAGHRTQCIRGSAQMCI